MNRQRDTPTWLAPALWQSGDLGNAVSALAAERGAPSVDGPRVVPPRDVELLGEWIEDSASRLGLQADQTFVGIEEIDDLLRHGAPMLLRLSSLEHAPFVAIRRASGRQVIAVDTTGQECPLPIASLCELIRAPFEEPLDPEIAPILERLNLSSKREARARTALIRDRLTNARFRGCWLLRLPPGSAVRAEAAESRIGRRLSLLVAASVGQYACFIGSWWLLGQAVLKGTVNRGWLFGWALLLASLMPLRLLVTREQGLLTVSVGAWLRRRLLRGAFQANRQLIRNKGVGELFTFVMEAAAIDAMALTGAVAAAFAVVEMVGAVLVLAWGATLWLIPVLLAWLAIAWLFARRYVSGRQAWTRQRITMSHDLLETMMGHRTRLVQQLATHRHVKEDDALERSIMLGEAMDRSGIALLALVPRGWLAVALATLIPALITGATASSLAISLGGILLVFRALMRLAAGFTQLTAAVVAAEAIRPLTTSASPTKAPLVPALRGSRSEAERTQVPALLARDLVFRYRSGDPVLTGASLTIERESRYLLEGGSGSGKTTFGALLCGLEQPESGLLLAGGLDRSALGSGAWHSRVVMAPQAHDNYLVGGSLAFNLLMGRRWPADRVDLQEAERLCRELGLGDLLDRMPGGLDQIVGETGWQLSQGERVRVFLARALLQKPDVLILDESFSALDPENLDRAARAVTTSSSAVLAIAHL